MGVLVKTSFLPCSLIVLFGSVLDLIFGRVSMWFRPSLDLVQFRIRFSPSLDMATCLVIIINLVQFTIGEI